VRRHQGRLVFRNSSRQHCLVVPQLRSEFLVAGCVSVHSCALEVLEGARWDNSVVSEICASSNAEARVVLSSCFRRDQSCELQCHRDGRGSGLQARVSGAYTHPRAQIHQMFRCSRCPSCYWNHYSSYMSQNLSQCHPKCLGQRLAATLVSSHLTWVERHLQVVATENGVLSCSYNIHRSEVYAEERWGTEPSSSCSARSTS